MMGVLGAFLVLSMATPSWRTLAEGVEYATLPLIPQPSIGDGILHVVRIDPARAKLRPLAISQTGGETRTAREWLTEHDLVAVINLGMFEGDYSTHTGFFRSGEHVNSRRWNHYQSILLLGPGEASIEDAAGRDAHAFAERETVVQNLRLIRAPGKNVWKQSHKKWSEAAIAQDRSGKLLFLFCRSPFTMHDLNDELLRLPLGIVRAMHVEGGPEASLSIRGKGIELHLSGSYETGFNEDDDNDRQWALPNVLGVEARRR